MGDNFEDFIEKVFLDVFEIKIRVINSLPLINFVIDMCKYHKFILRNLELKGHLKFLVFSVTNDTEIDRHVFVVNKKNI